MWRAFHLFSWAKGRNVAILGERPHKVTLQVLSLFPPTHRARAFSWIADNFYSFFLTLLWKFVSSISWYHVTYYFLWFSQHAYKEMFFYEVLTSILLCIEIKLGWTLQWNTFFGQCHFRIFHLSEELRILNTSIIAGCVHFLYSFCNPKNILLDLHRSPIEFAMKK